MHATFRKLSASAGPAAAVCLCLCSAGCRPDAAPSLRLPAVFSDHAVLQRDTDLPIWGWDAPGSEVTVQLAGQRKQAVAGPDGKWTVRMDPLPAGGPHLLIVHGTGRQIRRDILVGEVWICSGQSNMWWPLRNARNGAEQVAAASHDRLRLLTVPRESARTPQERIDAEWQHCRPETARDFSAVGYFFGRDLLEELQVPIGLIDSSWPGSAAEAWTPKDVLVRSETFAGRVEEMDRLMGQYAGREDELEQAYRQSLADYETRWRAYLQKVRTQEIGTKQKWHDPDLDDTGWKSADLPGAWDQSYLPDLDGVVWYRRSVEIPPEWADQDLILHLGPIDDDDVTYCNGHRIGHVGYGTSDNWWREPRRYTLPARHVKPGINHLAVRVMDLNGKGGFTGQPEQMRIEPARNDGAAEPVRLAGQWKYRVAYEAPSREIPRKPRRTSPPGLGHHDPAALYNAMIAPLQPYPIAGVIWYQGETNAGRPREYAELLAMLIRSWRRNWGQLESFSFYIVQLANYTPVAKVPNYGGWAWIREAQAQTARRVPGCGLAVTIDAGVADDVHPRDKQTVGRRLALQALQGTYGYEIVASGPVYQDHRVADGKMILRFRHTGRGLVSRAPDNKVRGFVITGDGETWHWAEAKIQDGKVVVWSEKVDRPIAVRYLWATNPGPVDLYNSASLPAGPFRTDTWVMKRLKP